MKNKNLKNLKSFWDNFDTKLYYEYLKTRQQWKN